MPKLVQIFANPSSSPGGAERILGKISHVARQMGWEVEEYHDQSFRLRTLTHRFPMINTVAKIWQLNGHLVRTCREADVVVSHGMYGAFLHHPRHIYVFHSTYAGMAEAVKAYVPRIDFLICRYLWGSFLEGRNARGASQCAAVSHMAQAEARKFYGVQSRVVYNCVDDHFRPISLSREELGLPLTGRLILVVGRREILKGRLLLARLAERLPAGVHLVSVGSGAEIPGVVSLAPVAPQRLPALYTAVDWVLAPSLYEGFGLTILESLACGTPVVCSPTGIALEMQGQEPAFDRCVASRTDCPDALYSVLIEALSDESLAVRQRAWGREMTAGSFSEEAFARSWTELLTDS